MSRTTASGLAAELQSKINAATAFSTAGKSVTVTESSGVLAVVSKSYGADSTVTISGGTAKASLFGSLIETRGMNAAGTIGSSPATASGQVLTGTGDASGLALTVTGDATGDRGTVKFSRGYAYELDKLVGKLLENDSLIDGRIDGINASIKDIDHQRDQMNARLDDVEKGYRAQFNALDAMMSRMQQTSTYLTQQLANLPKISSN